MWIKKVFYSNIMLWIAVLSLLALFSGTAEAATFVVNSTIDAADAIPGDGSCVTSGGPCSLRAAIEEANAPVGDDTISLPAGTYTLTLGAELTISSILTLTGADTTIIEAATTSGTASTRVINVTGGTVSISGVTIRHNPAQAAVSDIGAFELVTGASVQSLSEWGLIVMAFLLVALFGWSGRRLARRERAQKRPPRPRPLGEVLLHGQSLRTEPSASPAVCIVEPNFQARIGLARTPADIDDNDVGRHNDVARAAVTRGDLAGDGSG